jgi:hypothetical protein
MTARKQLLQEIQHSSEPLIKEVLDFLLFAKSRNYAFVEPDIVDQQPIWEFAQELLDTIEALPAPQKWQIYQTLSAKFAPYSAEAKAISRLADQDDPSKWITSIEEDEQIDEQALNAWLEKKGYQKANV